MSITYKVGDKVRVVGATTYKGERGEITETSPSAIVHNRGQYYRVQLDIYTRPVIFHTDNLRPVRSIQGKYSSSQYLSYEEGKKQGVFGRNNPVDLSIQETWWMIGFLVSKGSTAYSPAKKAGELNNDGTVREKQGGATRHLFFLDPKYPGLDVKLKVYFDESEIPATNAISINSKAWYEFMTDSDGVIKNSFDVPQQFKLAFEAGLSGAKVTWSREDDEAMTQDCGFSSTIGTATFNRSFGQ
jgi:hypothetical protein